MPVRTMRSVVDVVADSRVPPAAAEAAGRWSAVSPIHFRSGANHVFRVEAGYLRLTPASERSVAGIRAELDFILLAGAAGVEVARPLHSQGGSLVEEVAGDGEIYHAVLFAALGGRGAPAGRPGRADATRLRPHAGEPAPRVGDVPSGCRSP